MTDLQQFLTMIVKSPDPYIKETSGNGWKIEFPKRGVKLYFSKEGEFQFVSTN